MMDRSAIKKRKINMPYDDTNMISDLNKKEEINNDSIFINTSINNSNFNTYEPILPSLNSNIDECFDDNLNSIQETKPGNLI